MRFALPVVIVQLKGAFGRGDVEQLIDRHFQPCDACLGVDRQLVRHQIHVRIVAQFHNPSARGQEHIAQGGHAGRGAQLRRRHIGQIREVHASLDRADRDVSADGDGQVVFVLVAGQGDALQVHIAALVDNGQRAVPDGSVVHGQRPGAHLRDAHVACNSAADGNPVDVGVQRHGVLRIDGQPVGRHDARPSMHAALDDKLQVTSPADGNISHGQVGGDAAHRVGAQGDVVIGRRAERRHIQCLDGSQRSDGNAAICGLYVQQSDGALAEERD